MTDWEDSVDMSAERAAMAAKGRKVKPQIRHPGSASGQHWEPDQHVKDQLGDAFAITKEVIEEP